MLDRLLDDGEADLSLIGLLSNTPVADLVTYPRRPEVWPQIRGVAFNNLIAADRHRVASESGQRRSSVCPGRHSTIRHP